jgi:hypothetical protein
VNVAPFDAGDPARQRHVRADEQHDEGLIRALADAASRAARQGIPTGPLALEGRALAAALITRGWVLTDTMSARGWQSPAVRAAGGRASGANRAGDAAFRRTMLKQVMQAAPAKVRAKPTAAASIEYVRGEMDKLARGFGGASNVLRAANRTIERDMQAIAKNIRSPSPRTSSRRSK